MILAQIGEKRHPAGIDRGYVPDDMRDEDRRTIGFLTV